MGIIISRFRKEKTTTELLEGIEEKIQEIEKYTINTQEQKKRFVGNFLAISIGIYVIAFVVFYFVYFPPTWKERMIYSVPLFLFPIVIILLRKLFTWYFQRKLNKNSKRLMELRADKKKILEKVMDKETYKVAVNLLARFGDKSFGARPSLGMTPRPNVTVTSAAQSGVQLNQSLRAPNTATAVALTPRVAPANVAPRQIMQQTRATQELRRRTPFPVLDFQNKGVFDRIVDVLMGDGPQDRFAMICKECYAHNGMALKDDFDFMAFRCAFCNLLNPARKARQVAPLLPQPDSTPSPYRAIGRDSSDSSSTSSDESDTADLLKKNLFKVGKTDEDNQADPLLSKMETDMDMDMDIEDDLSTNDMDMTASESTKMEKVTPSNPVQNQDLPEDLSKEKQLE